MTLRRLTCFVVMPFGRKALGGRTIDFDLVFEKLIVPAIEQAGFEPQRSDTAPGSIISAQLFNDLLRADVVIADVTMHNPNVYYELGVRHALARHGTVLIRRDGGSLGVGGGFPFSRKTPDSHEIPFDTKDIRTLHYRMDEASLGRSITELERAIQSSRKDTETDSPVYQSISNLSVTRGATKAREGQDELLEIVGAEGRRIGYRSGDVSHLKGPKAVDFWVNSENTFMQMARMYERAFSSTIRHLGARNPDPNSPEYEDTIADDLKRVMGTRRSVNVGDVLVTTSGKLAQTHGVRAVLHVATVVGVPGYGFRPVSDDLLEVAVDKAISTARDLVRSGDPAYVDGRSILLPLFATGQGARRASDVAGQLVSHAIEALRSAGPVMGAGAPPDLTTVWFAAYTDDDVRTMRRLFEGLRMDGRLREPGIKPGT